MRPTFDESVRLRFDVLKAPKDGSNDEEYEDAFRVPAGLTASSYRGCTVAVADGASESMLAGRWAGRLVSVLGGLGGVDLSDPAVLARHICDAAADWQDVLREYVQRRTDEGRPIAWYEEPKLEQGAYAALLGLSFHPSTGPAPSGGGVWSAAALGDCCVFHVREERLVAAFPIDSADAFGSTPSLAATRNLDLDLIGRHVETRHGSWLPGDVFYMTTDAAAQWFLAECGPLSHPGRLIDAALDEPEPWLGDLRRSGRIRNDDTTIVRCAPERS